jgi:hypothetical protein
MTKTKAYEPGYAKCERKDINASTELEIFGVIPLPHKTAGRRLCDYKYIAQEVRSRGEHEMRSFK